MPDFSTAPARSWSGWRSGMASSCASPMPGGQVRADQAPALRPRQAVQACQQGPEDTQDLSRPRHPRHRSQTRWQRRLARWDRQRGPKIYSLHAPEVECIGKGKAHRPYEFGVKVSVATTLSHAKGGQFVAHIKALPGNRSAISNPNTEWAAITSG